MKITIFVQIRNQQRIWKNDQLLVVRILLLKASMVLYLYIKNWNWFIYKRYEYFSWYRTKGTFHWIDKKWNLIPEHFTKTFTIEAASFVLLNNSFQFDIYIFAISWYCNVYEFGPPYACFSVGYFEEIFYFQDYYPFTLH